MNIICNYALTDHASCRAQQRGVKRETLTFIIVHADIWLHAGEGRRTIRISHRHLSRLTKEGAPASLVERASNVVVMLNPSTAEVVTVLHDVGSKNGRKYRKQWPTRSHKWRCNHRRRERTNQGRHFPNQMRSEGEAIH